MARIKSYWDSEGTYQALNDRLHTLIPSSGAVEDAKGKNRALEKLRVATNCYYDLFNNGLCNRAAEFRRVFGFGGSAIVKSRYQNSLELEEKMDEIILAAAREQGIAVVEPKLQANINASVDLLNQFKNTLPEGDARVQQIVDVINGFLLIDEVSV